MDRKKVKFEKDWYFKKCRDCNKKCYKNELKYYPDSENTEPYHFEYWICLVCNITHKPY